MPASSICFFSILIHFVTPGATQASCWVQVPVAFATVHGHHFFGWQYGTSIRHHVILLQKKRSRTLNRNVSHEKCMRTIANINMRGETDANWQPCSGEKNLVCHTDNFKSLVTGHRLRAAATILVCRKHVDSRADEVYLDHLGSLSRKSTKFPPNSDKWLDILQGSCSKTFMHLPHQRHVLLPEASTFLAQGILAQRAYLGYASLICVVTIVFDEHGIYVYVENIHLLDLCV